MIMGALRSMICILRPNSKGSPFSLTSIFTFLTRIKTRDSLVTSSQNLQNISHQLHFFSKSFIISAASEEQRLKIMGVFAFTCYDESCPDFEMKILCRGYRS